MRISIYNPASKQVEDVKFRRPKDYLQSSRQVIYLGYNIIGQCWGDKYTGFDILAHNHSKGLALVKGFRRKLDALNYLLEVGGYIGDYISLEEAIADGGANFAVSSDL